ncbi:hypothetical protein [Rhodohalobacter halophilus]|uniref:hypothetical protein n=1 Tax=Rhodohalobacter halophilus TaxID=1812810 RepID=UPI00083FCB09|nr:hypothetical protein [Rhodohalobacter halophilus]
MNRKKSIAILFLFTTALLLIPFTAMQFSKDVVWSLSDFIIAGILIFGTGLSYILITNLFKSSTFRIAVGFSLLSGLFLIWSNMAVGLIGSENNPINLLYFLVIFTGIAGAFISRFKPRGLANTMFSAATVTFVIAISALLTGAQHLPHSSVYEILAVNGFFITLFIVGGMLFRFVQNSPGPETEAS